MKRALVIRTMGDPLMADAIVDGMTTIIIPPNELMIVKAECERLKNRNALHSYGDDLRFRLFRAEMNQKYAIVEHSRAYDIILCGWATICYGIHLIIKNHKKRKERYS